ncbi:hypothetical protein [Amycolatopsis sp. H20-H5]|uniref:hypothetical protein n=1 Tax=Amycolatopsis sp. H20-H5 TaxID=3046309 RepID=UPI002DB8AA2F|nr:hypothetical protein [Amycolatopsis sp. H20-H5]MEC3981623.1 hypothetical protein [Amycolatopsis sp. H20-H5]
MHVGLIIIGVVFLGAAAIGGGVKASGAEVGEIKTFGAQIALGVVGFLAIVLGIFVGWIAPRIFGSAEAPPPVSSQPNLPLPLPGTPSQSAPPPSSPAPVSTPAPTPDPERVFWSGTITLDEYADVKPAALRDLDSKPPKTDKNDGDIGAGDIESSSAEYTYGYLLGPRGATTVAQWTAGGAPTRAQCREAASASGSATVEMKLGGYACVRTSQGRTASLKITKIIGDESLQAAATVWDDADQ